MKKKTIVMSTVAAAFILANGCMTACAAEADAPSYLAGQQSSAARNRLYAQAEQLPEEERDAFLAENGIGETPYSEEAAASYSYVAGQKRGSSYRQSDDAERTQDTSGYGYLIGQKRGASYQQ